VSDIHLQSFLALRDAGVDYRGQNVGCFMAAVQHDVFMLSEQVYILFDAALTELTDRQDETEVQGSFATPPAMVANRVSYHLDLRGPSVPMDTACSSTLTATHLAIQSLNAGDCTSAIVGGAQINHRSEFSSFL
jgi:acyl transferase domain-containing protein